MSAATFKAAGNAALAAKDFDAAIEAYTKAIAVDSTDSVFFSNRSAAYLSKGDAASALADAESAVNLKPSWGKAFGRKGAALHALSRFDEAVAAYEKGMAVDPSDALKAGLAEAADAGAAAAARAAAREARASSGFPGGFPGFPGAGPFGPDMFTKLATQPKFVGYLADASFRAQLSALQRDPNALATALGLALGQDLGGGGAAPGAPKDPRMLEVVQFLLGGSEWLCRITRASFPARKYGAPPPPPPPPHTHTQPTSDFV